MPLRLQTVSQLLLPRPPPAATATDKNHGIPLQAGHQTLAEIRAPTNAYLDVHALTTAYRKLGQTSLHKFNRRRGPSQRRLTGHNLQKPNDDPSLKKLSPPARRAKSSLRPSPGREHHIHIGSFQIAREGSSKHKRLFGQEKPWLSRLRHQNSGAKTIPCKA
jgi:hypothetical protein